MLLTSEEQIPTLALPGCDGSYLPKQESGFVLLVLDELDGYQQRLDRNSVLVFPPLPSRLRFLIHKTTESHPELATFSVGEDWSRRVVVCFSELRANVEDDSDPESNRTSSVGKAAQTPRNRGQKDRARGSRTRASKRPDRAFYTPHAARQRPPFSQPPPAPARGPEPPGSGSCSAASESAPRTDVPAAAPHGPAVDPAPGSPRDGVVADDSNGPPEDIKAALPEAPGIDPGTCSLSFDQTLSNFTVMSLDQGRGGREQQLEEEAEGGDSEERGKEIAGPRDGTPTPDMNAVTAKITEEISAGLKEPDGVAIEYVHNDYSVFENALINTGEFDHVIEIYGFPAVFKTDDLMDAFTDYSNGGMKITWVDDTHALAVFSSETAAHQALSISHPLLKTRALSQASRQSQAKASQRAEFIQPVKERPKTDSAVARRMVTRALGLQRGQAKRKEEHRHPC